MTDFDPAQPHTASAGSAAATREATTVPTSDRSDPGRPPTLPLGTRGADARPDHARMLAWEDQLRSIQQLGQRLATLTTVSQIGQAICNEIRELVDSHNVRVYRVHGEDVVAVAWRGEIGEYADETGEELNVRVGQGITGWVARHGVPQYLPDAARDPRSETMAGTDPNLDESMLLAPMRFDDRTIGVIVLSRLGVDQFAPDDLRYLEIYAAMAAQAMATADATQLLRAQSELLARQLEAQRHLLRATESILSTLDPHGIVEEIARRVGNLVPMDTMLLVTRERDSDVPRVLLAEGQDAGVVTPQAHADVAAMGEWMRRHASVLRLQHDIPPPEDLHLDRVWDDGALVVAPLLGAGEIMGVLACTRVGDGAAFDDSELELIQLFAGHVAIAMRNAVQHQEVELRAQTDSLTGLKNHGTFQVRLDRWVTSGRPFSLLIVDMDGFKSYNDEHGHMAGNQLLREIGETFLRACRDSDEIFRYGGDEFAIILPGSETPGALEVANRIGRAVRELRAGTGAAGTISCSVGVASWPADGTDRDGLVLAADRACYAAKAAGRDRAATAADAFAVGSIHGEPFDARPRTVVGAIAEH
ncbi:MAG: diguanylate cyclase [Chloroflexota bacterium]